MVKTPNVLKDLNRCKFISKQINGADHSAHGTALPSFSTMIDGTKEYGVGFRGEKREREYH